MIELCEVDLAAPSLPDAACRSLLSGEELARADRFHFERDRLRFLRRRAARRLWLSSRLGIPASGIRFLENACGRPAVVGAPEAFAFNATASGDRALLAAVHGAAVGVDVEQWRPLGGDLEGLILRLAPGERRTLLALPPGARADRFFECWTRKEAMAKAAGLGLSLPLEAYEVPLDAQVAEALIHWPEDPLPHRRWLATSLSLGHGWSGAVVSDQSLPLHREVFAWL